MSQSEDVQEPRRANGKWRWIFSLVDTENVKPQRQEPEGIWLSAGAAGGMAECAKQRLFHLNKAPSGWREEKLHSYSPALKHMTKPGC